MEKIPAVLAIVPSIILVSFAAALAIHRKEGWGWFLFAGLTLGYAALQGVA